MEDAPVPSGPWVLVRWKKFGIVRTHGHVSVVRESEQGDGISEILERGRDSSDGERARLEEAGRRYLVVKDVMDR